MEMLQNRTTVRFIFILYFQAMAESELPAKTARSSALDAAAPKSQHKGRQTKAAIVDAALVLAAQIGLQGLSIGALAAVMRMSKSGVFAHFGSREELQISVIREYHARFEEEVFFSALQQPRGLPRLEAMFHNWMQRTSVEIDSGCLYISGAVEFDDRPGPVRDALAGSVRIWLSAIHRVVAQAREAGHLRRDADEHQMAFEIHALILASHYEARFLETPGSIARATTGFANILARYGNLAAAAAPAASSSRSPKKAASKSFPSKSV
jgi:AcrR family transcriptional regulator